MQRILLCQGYLIELSSTYFTRYGYSNKSKLSPAFIVTVILQQIMKYTREGHYQIACKVYFDATHSGADDQDVHINHPNQYFDESQLFYSGKKEGRLQFCNSGQMYPEL